MFLEISGLCNLVHKKLDFYESSSRSNEPISEPSKNIFNRKINQLSDSSCHLSAFNPTNSSSCSRERATFLLSKNIYSLFNLNPSDYELQTTKKLWSFIKQQKMIIVEWHPCRTMVLHIMTLKANLR